MLKESLFMLLTILFFLGCTQITTLTNNSSTTPLNPTSNITNTSQSTNQTNLNQSNNNSDFGCLPQNINLTKIAEAHSTTINGSFRVNRTTIEQKLVQLGATCNNGKLVDTQKREIIFFQLTGCWGAQPSNYQEIMAKQQEELNSLEQNYTVITLTCNPTGIPLPQANTMRDTNFTSKNSSFFNPFGSVQLQSCDSNNILFTNSPLAFSDFTNIIPLGNPNPPDHIFPTDHIYLYIRRNGSPTQSGALAPPAEVPVVSPGNITILQIDSKYYISSTMLPNFQPHIDYMIQFSPCGELFVRFDHLASLSDKIKSQFNESSDKCLTSNTGSTIIRHCITNVQISLNAGDPIGTAGGSTGSNALDFGAFDLRIPQHSFANPSRWGFNSLNVVCPLDYFTSDLIALFRSRLGSYNGTIRTVEPVCGEVAQDINNTAQGVWFVKGTTQSFPEYLHMALVHDNIDPTKGVFSVGSSTSKSGLSPGKYYFTPLTSGLTNRDFNGVVPDGNVYCYNTQPTLQGNQAAQTTVILIQMLDNTSLRIEKQQLAACGTGPWSFDTSYTDFER